MQRIHPSIFYILLVCGIFLSIIAPKVFSEGMFFDGVTYASISRNMAEGMGTFWKPYFADVAFPVFYEHPPLALGIQALFFKLFGDTIYVERVYALLNIVLSVYLMVCIWSKLSKQRVFAFLPVLFFLINGAVIWAAPNNMLESTMLNLLLLSVLFFIKSTRDKRWGHLFLSGLFIMLAFLTKGPTALYLWVLPFWYFLLVQRKGLIYSVAQSLLLAVFSLIPLGLLFLIQPDSFSFFIEYVDRQVLRSLTSVQNVSTRFYILKDFFINNLLGIAVTIIVLTLAGIKKRYTQTNRLAYVFMLTALCGVLPVMISLKQSGHYILTTYPLFAIGLALGIVAYLKGLRIPVFQSIGFKIFCLVVFGVSLILMLNGIGRVNRNSDLVKLTRAIQSKADNVSIVCVDSLQMKNYPLNAYLMRYNKISLSEDTTLLYHIVKSDVLHDTIGKVVLRSGEYILYERR